MTTQPEALRLADEMLNYWNERGPDAEAVAAELSRLHAENEALRAALHMVPTLYCKDLHHNFKDRHGMKDPCPVAARINAAIDAAKEKQ